MPARNLIELFPSANYICLNSYDNIKLFVVVVLHILNIKINRLLITAENVIKHNSFSFRYVACIECDAITRKTYKLMVY